MFIILFSSKKLFLNLCEPQLLQLPWLGVFFLYGKFCNGKKQGVQSFAPAICVRLSDSAEEPAVIKPPGFSDTGHYADAHQLRVLTDNPVECRLLEKQL